MFRFCLIVFFCLIFRANTFAQQKNLAASKCIEKIAVDGELNEAIWQTAEIAEGFTQTSPKPGEAASHKTTVKVIYDNNALYIGAECFDEPKQISKILSERDDFNANIDNFQLTLDTYNDDQNGFVFGVSSMGVLYDAKIFVDEESPELNMVWNASVKRTETGWQVEMRIPYSAFRFAKKDVQNWGINFYRYISRNREHSYWNPVKPDLDNKVTQCGNLTNVSGIEPPLRIAFIPYVSGYANHFDGGTGKNWTYSYNGGMDIKYGINEAFTVDMTLVPDFGQVVFDNKVLNLSPYEIQFNENRQFFTEGTELFSKAGLFYSRRIGIQTPYEVAVTQLKPNEELTYIPSNTQLYNATKLSGRNTNGLGIGVFNGITAPQFGTATNTITNEERKIEVSPLSNYNVLVFDQNLKNNSYINFTNTNVMRNGSFYDANVSALNTTFNTKDNAYFVSANSSVSQKFYSASPEIGHNAEFTAGKQSGKYIYSTSYFEESDKYNPNDLGYNAFNNQRYVTANVERRIFEPFWKLNSTATSIGFSYNRLYNPNVYTNSFVSVNSYATTKRFHAMGFNFTAALTPNYDYFEPRVTGRCFVRPRSLDGGFWFSSNYQKRFALDLNLYSTVYENPVWKEFFYMVSPRLRISNKCFLIYNWQHAFSFNEQGYAVPFGEPTETTNQIIFGSRNRIDVTNTINLRYSLSNLMGITFRLRHYRSALMYNSFYDLQSDGSLLKNNHAGLDLNSQSVYNTNFNAFTIDMVYRWVFQPGCEINIVWKNSIFSNDKKYSETYLQNLNSTLAYQQLNSFSIKVIYWLDYIQLKKKK